MRSIDWINLIRLDILYWKMQGIISSTLYETSSTKDNIFDVFIGKCKAYLDSPAHNLVDLRKKTSTTIKGNLFEEFCVLYLKNVRHMKNVWRLPDVPEDILISLKLKRRDIGIDIIAENNGLYHAVQCKFKTPKGVSKISVGWKELSTFYSLCARTGPWEKHIVMTTASYIRHMGLKGEKDLSICLKSFQNITREQWLSMSGSQGRTLESTSTTTISIDQMREARLKYLSK